jgi:hypothetical protein
MCLVNTSAPGQDSCPQIFQKGLPKYSEMKPKTIAKDIVKTVITFSTVKKLSWNVNAI